LKLRVSSKDIDSIETSAIVLLFFHDERPLKGSTGLADWRMNGAISRLIISERINGNHGETTLVVPNRRILGEKILMIGLGNSSDLRNDKIEEAAESAVDHLVGIGIKDFTIAIPHAGSTSMNASEIIEAVIKGMKKIDKKLNGLKATLQVEKDDLKEVKTTIESLKKGL
jgi:leucyl aminopeptidase